MTSIEQQTTRKRSQRTLAVIVAVAAVVAIGVAFGVAKLTGGDDTVPYTDSRSAGRLTLCTGGERVTGGKLADRPFAEFVLGETALGQQYDAQGAVAALYAYQPRNGIDASEFSGNVLTQAATLLDATKPAARLSDESWSLEDFTTAFPATWDGYVQLRLYLGTPAAGTLTTEPYDTADIKVSGDEWTLVSGGSQSCSDAASAVVPAPSS